jgi:HK97 family phage major capsid protein
MNMSLPISPLAKGTGFVRLACVLASARTNEEARGLAERWPDSPAVKLVLNAVVDPMDTSNTSALVRYGIAAEVLELLRAISVFERLRGFMRRVRFLQTMVKETTGASAGWIAEAGILPPIALNFDDALCLPPYKAGVMVVLTDELARLGQPGAVETARRILLEAVAKFLDKQFLDPSVAAVADTNPASVTNGAQSVISTGSSSAQILTDLSGMTAKLGSWVEPRWIMRPSTASAIAGSSSTLFPLIRATPDGGTLLGIPVVNSVNSPPQITLLDLNDVLLADDGEIGLTAARQANIDVDDGGSPAVIRPISLWQNNLVSVRVMRRISWMLGHSDSCVSMAVSY